MVKSERSLTMCEGKIVSSTKYDGVARAGGGEFGLDVEWGLCREFGGRGIRG